MAEFAVSEVIDGDIFLRKNSFVASRGGADIHVGPKEQKNRTFFCDQQKRLSQIKALD